ncbi:hypothetical protein MYX82_08470 [Acidobacteria bacterium AH-259-D05]|nr:hypothetical protein [Acidobacteria bacterium AH-259-D05]
MADSWKKESLNLKVGDWIIWKDEKIEIEEAEGTIDTFIAPGMIGKVISLHDGIPPEDPRAEIIGKEVPPRVLVDFENGQRMLLRADMNFERMVRQ